MIVTVSIEDLVMMTTMTIKVFRRHHQDDFV